MAGTLRRNFLNLLFARGLTLALALVNAVLLARYLGPKDFGLYSYAFSVTTIVFGLADLGLSSHVARLLRLEPARRTTLLNAFARLTNTMSLLLSAAVIVLAWVLVTDRLTRWALTLVCLPQFFRAAAVPVRALLTSEEQIPQLGLQELAIRAGTLLLLLVTMLLRQGVLMMVWVSAVPMLASYAYLRRRYWPSDSGSSSARNELAGLSRQAWAFTLYALFYAAYFQIDVVLLEKLQPLTNVGYYGAATRFIYPLLQVSSALMTSAFPRLVTVADSQRRRFNLKLLMTLVGVGVLFAVCLAGSASWLLPLLVGKRYAPAVLTLQIMALYVPLTFVQALGANILLAAGRIRALVGVYGSGLVANVALNLWLIPRYAHNGCAVATVAAEALVLAITAGCVWSSWRGSLTTTATETDIEPGSPRPD